MSWTTYNVRDSGGNTVAVLVDAVAAGKALGVQNATDGDPLGAGTQSVVTTAGGSTIAAQNLSRKRVEVSNGGTTAVWITFGSTTPVVGTGNLLPPGAKDVYYTTSAVKGISVTSANTCGYTEW